MDWLRAIARLLLPGIIRRPIADRIYRLIAWGIRVLWENLLSHRYLLAIEIHALSFRQRLQRMTLMAFLAFFDGRYRKHFINFGRTLALLSQPAEPASRTAILLTIGTLGPGGSERQAVLTLIGLAGRNYRPLELLCLHLQSQTERFFLPQLAAAGITVNELERDTAHDAKLGCEPALKAALALPYHLRDVANYVSTLSVRRPSVLHAWLDETNIKAGLAAVAMGVPRIVLGLRSLPPINFPLHQPYMREGYRWLAKQPGVVLLNNSVAGARAYEEWIGLPEGTIRVVHNGFAFDTDLLASYRNSRNDYRARHGIPVTAPLIGTVIRLTEEKRPLLWLEIAAAVRRQLPDAHFLIVGDGPLRGELEARSKRDDLQGAVHLAGYEKEALAAIAAMDVFLLTSRAEGLPNVLVEAQALGVPAVTTKVGGAPETVCHGVTGWILERDDSQHAADILVKLLQDESWRSKVRREAPDFVRSAFGVERMLDQTVAIYDAALEPQ